MLISIRNIAKRPDNRFPESYTLKIAYGIDFNRLEALDVLSMSLIRRHTEFEEAERALHIICDEPMVYPLVAQFLAYGCGAGVSFSSSAASSSGLICRILHRQEDAAAYFIGARGRMC